MVFFHSYVSLPEGNPIPLAFSQSPTSTMVGGFRSIKRGREELFMVSPTSTTIIQIAQATRSVGVPCLEQQIP